MRAELCQNRYYGCRTNAGLLRLYFGRDAWIALVWIIAGFSGLFLSTPAEAQIIPADRRITWQDNVGVPNGVFQYTNRTVFTNMTGIDNTGSTDVTAAIQHALDICPSNQVVKLPAGTFRINSYLQIPSYVTLRGAGTTTVLDGHGSGSLGIVGFGSFNNTSVGGVYQANGVPTTAANITGATNGSSSIVVSSASGLSVGMLMCIDELNNTNFVDTRCAAGNDLSANSCASRVGYDRLAGQVVYITKISGTTISFDPPLFWNFTNSPQEVSVPCYARYAGVEDLKTYANNSGYNCNISMVGVAYCWVRNVECDYADGNQMTVKTCCRCEIRDSYFHDGYAHTAGSTDDCLLLGGHSTGLLVENNILRRLHISIMVEHGGGGHVIAYNYSTNNFDQYGYNTVFSDYDYHGAHVAQVLWEGNFGSKFNQDGGWASGSHGTVFRNFFYGENWCCPPYSGRGPEQTNQYTHQCNSVICVNLAFNSSYFNFVGNVLGDNNINPNYVNGVSGGSYPCYYQRVALTDPAAGYSDAACFQFGYSGTTFDNPYPSFTTALRHGNWDCVNKTQLWDSTISDHSIPNSLYLTNKPAWFGNLTWPPVNPATGNANSLMIPAEYRYLTGTNPPAGVANLPPVAQASAAPTNGSAPLTVSFSSAGSSDPEGAALTYSWAFGDGGTSTTANPSHTYSSAGTYSAQLSVSDGTNAVSSTPITIRVTVAGSNQPPIVAAAATPTSGIASLTVAFSSAGSYDPEGSSLTYNWNFGDGSTSTAASPSHTYAAGTFKAQLQISDGTNTTSSTQLTIVATNPVPSVALTSPTNGGGYTGPAAINLAASVTPNGHTITKVQFYNGAALLGEDSTAPYTFGWTNVSAGSYTLTARAIYDAGATVDSSAVTIAVGGLIASYGFEEGSGSTVTDVSGSGNTGTINGATWTVSGKYGSALVFNGTSAKVTINDTASLHLTTAMTLEAWVNPSTIDSTWRDVIYKGDDNFYLSGCSFYGGVPVAGGRFGSSGTNGEAYSTGQLALGVWTHVACTYDGTTIRLYLNGTQVASKAQTGNMATSTNPLQIGGDSIYGQYFAGIIDEVRVYNRALSATEIQQDMITPVVVRLQPPSNLVIMSSN